MDVKVWLEQALNKVFDELETGEHTLVVSGLEYLRPKAIALAESVAAKLPAGLAIDRSALENAIADTFSQLENGEHSVVVRVLEYLRPKAIGLADKVYQAMPAMK